MAGEKEDCSPIRIPFGNCEVTVQGVGGSSVTGTGGCLEIKTNGPATIKLYVVDKERELLRAFLVANQKESSSLSNCAKKPEIVKPSASSKLQARSVRGRGRGSVGTRGGGRRGGTRRGVNAGTRDG